MTATQIKKISVAKVFGNIVLSKLIKATDQRMRVMDVIGMAVGTKIGESDYGEWSALQGTFEARNPVSGELFKSVTCFLPDVALIPIQVGLAQAGARGVSFAIGIDVVYVAEREGAKAGGSPYEYAFVELLAPTEEEDPIARIKARMLAALEAPGKNAEGDAAQDNGSEEPAPSVATKKRK